MAMTEEHWYRFNPEGAYYNGQHKPSDDAECLVLLKNGEIWHCLFDGYTDSYASPPDDFVSVHSFGEFGRLRFRDEVVAYNVISGKSMLKEFGL